MFSVSNGECAGAVVSVAASPDERPSRSQWGSEPFCMEFATSLSDFS